MFLLVLVYLALLSPLLKKGTENKVALLAAYLYFNIMTRCYVLLLVAG